MSFQVQPQAQPQQPVQVYPISVTNQPPSHHSNGSFGTVFIVLAVILVISLLACFLGRLCSRWSHPESHHGGGGHGPKPFKQQQNMNQLNQNHHFRPKEGDVELGFDKRIPTTRPNLNGPGPGLGYGGRGPRPLYGGGGGGGNGRVHNDEEEKSFEMKNGSEGSMREQGHGQGHGPGHKPGPGFGYGGRGPRPLVYGAGGGNGGVGGGEEKGFDMRNGGERSRREQGYGHEHDAPYKFTL